MKKVLIISYSFALLFLNACKIDNVDIKNEVIVGSSIETSVTWTADKVYRVDSTVEINNTLTIEPGTTIKFGKKGQLKIDINATLIAEGTTQKPIKFTSLQANSKAGDWGGLYFNDFHCKSVIKNCILEYGTVAVSIDNGFVNIDNCIIREMSEGGVIENSILPENGSNIVNNSFSNISGTTIKTSFSNCGCLAIGNKFSNCTYVEFSWYSSTQTTDPIILYKLDIPYFVTTLFVSCLNIRINSGVTVKFSSEGVLAADRCQITAIGTSKDPITFTSANSNPLAGDWQGLTLFGDIEFNNVIINYGGANDNYSLTAGVFSDIVKVSNTQILNHGGIGVKAVTSVIPTGSGNNFTWNK